MLLGSCAAAANLNLPQLLARDSITYAIADRPLVRLSHGWISQNDWR